MNAEEGETAHQRSRRLVAELRTKSATASEGDQLARFWVHGLNHWVGMDAAGEIANVLAITPDILPMFPHMADDQFQAFIAGYQHAVAMDAAGFESVSQWYRDDWSDDE